MTELDTNVIAVAVYPDRARITRGGSLALEPGEHKLEISQLPLKLDPASARASARGAARARLLGVSVRRDFYTESPAERVRELEKQLELLGDDMHSLEAQAKLLKQERTALGELTSQTEIYARGLAFAKTNAKAQMLLFASLRERIQQINAEQLELTIRRRDLERRLQKAQKELDRLRGARGRERYVAIIDVEVLQAGELNIELTYVVSDAGWQPLYDLRLLEQADKPTLELGYLAQVEQRTGEDWANVALKLSTARPALAETVPELDPWYVGAFTVRAKQRRSALYALAAPEDIDKSFGEMEKLDDQFGAEDEVEAEEALASVDTSGAAVTYQVTGAVNVPADGEPHKVTVARLELTPKMDYVSAPKLVEAAYRRAQVSNDTPYTLLPGPVNLFAGVEFIGTTELELTAPQGEIELYLGADDRIKVQRELKRRDVDKRLIGDKRRLRYSYEITLENLLPTEAQVTLHDHIPLPRHEDIKVKLDEAEPKPQEQSDLNLLCWELTLAPAAKQTVRLDFTVEHPRSMNITGLP